jgi:hypothetical protein
VTVAVAVKVFDGIVVAADSATTLTLPNGSHQVYNGATKVFQLHRTLPLAAVTWGLGSIASASIATLAKDLRRRFMGADPMHGGWKLDPSNYTVENVANRLTEMMFDELWAPEYAGQIPAVVGFLIVGYSANAPHSEAWKVVLEDPLNHPTPIQVAAPDQAGWLAYAQPEAVNRLFHGYNVEMKANLLALADPSKRKDMENLLDAQERLAVVPPMPLFDAIDLARFMVDVTCGYSRWLLGPDTVGGPIEIASISRHEGFKWISRKHYYQAELNPKEPNHDV